MNQFSIEYLHESIDFFVTINYFVFELDYYSMCLLSYVLEHELVYEQVSKRQKRLILFIRFYKINIPEMEMEQRYFLDLISKCPDVNERRHLMVDVLSKI